MTDAWERYSEKVREIVCELLELTDEEITPDGLFNEDYGADSLRAIEILGALEREFGIVIDQAELPGMVNLRAVTEIVARSAGQDQP